MTLPCRSPWQCRCTLCRQYVSSVCLPLDLLPLPSASAAEILSVSSSSLPHGAEGLWLDPVGWEGSSWWGQGRQSRALNEFQGNRAMWFSGGTEPRSYSLGWRYHSNPSPGLCTRKGYRHPAAKSTAESLGRRGRKFSTRLGFCPFFRIKI